MQHQRTTELTPQQFTTLLTALTHRITWSKPGGRPPALPLTQALKITLLYHRHNFTKELLAEIFNTSHPTISRAVNSIEKALQELFSPLVLPLNWLAKYPGPLVIDGTLIPT